MALTEVTDNNQSTSVWFPSGITACLVLKDPGTAFKEFYWALRDYMASYRYNTCQARRSLDGQSACWRIV